MKGIELARRGKPLALIFPVVGKKAIGLVDNLGAMAVFFLLAFVNIFRRKQLREIVNQVFYIGATSSLIVMLVGLFTGMVLGLRWLLSRRRGTSPNCVRRCGRRHYHLPY